MNWKQLHTAEIDGFQVFAHLAPDESCPQDDFDCFETEEQKKEFFRKIDQGIYSWVILRVQAFRHGVMLGESYLGGCCYENNEEMITDGVFEDCAYEAIEQAKQTLAKILEGEREVETC